MPARQRNSIRYELRGTWRFIRALLTVGAFALLASLVFSLLSGDFEVLASVGLVATVVLSLYGVGVRNTIYVILDESQVHIREWRVGARMPYDSIERVELNPSKGEVKIIYHPTLWDGRYATYTIHYTVSPQDPERVAEEIRRRADVALSSGARTS